MLGSSIPVRRRLLGSLMLLCYTNSLIVSAAPPVCWSTGNPPVIDPYADRNDFGTANIGQAKWMAKQALEDLNTRFPAIAAQVSADLVGEGKPIASWDAPVTPEQQAQQRQPLLLGQLKAIAKPFYDHLHDANPNTADWLAEQLTQNGTTKENSHYPWTVATTDDANKAVATIGQLKAVFSLRFESISDRDLDGLLDSWEIQYFGNLNAGPEEDPDNDGLTNIQEMELGSAFNPFFPYNPNIGQETIVNGDFSALAIGNVGASSGEPNWDYWPGIPGWKAVSGSNVELQTITPKDNDHTNQYCELKAHPDGNGGIKQLIGTKKGRSYVLTFEARTRDDVPPEESNFYVQIKGVLNKPINFENKSNWSTHTLQFTATKGITELFFVPTGEANTTGCLVDNVNLLPVDITVAFGLGAEPVGPKDSRQLLETYLETIKVSRMGDTWFVKFTNAQGVESFHGVEIVTTKEKLIDALKQSGQKVVFDGHSNFGLGPNFSGKVTHKTIADFTHFGVGKTSIPKSFRGNGSENDVVPFTNGGGVILPTNPQDLEAIDRVHAEGWAYLKLGPGQIIAAPQNYPITELGIERFKNIQNIGPGSTFTKQGNGFNNEWHFDNPEGSRRLIVQAPSTDVPTLGYAKFFYNACNTGRDYIESFKHGDFIYTKDSCKVEDATKIFVKGVIEGKSNNQIMTDLNQDGVGNVGSQSSQIYGFKTF